MTQNRQADRVNQELLSRMNQSGHMHVIPSMVRGKYIIRFCVTYEHATEEHIGKTNKITIINLPKKYIIFPFIFI